MRNSHVTKELLPLLVAVLLCGSGVTAQTGTWKNYTSMKEVTGVARAGADFWASTRGGLFQWDAGGSAYRRFTNAEGLRSIDLTAVAVDSTGEVWSGSSTGVLHVLSPTNQTVRIITDIANANQTNKTINSLSVAGDTVLIGTDFGLSIFTKSRFEFGDTFTRFGNIPSTSRTAVFASLLFDGKIWACISDGQTVNRVAFANLSTPNLLPPESWTLQSVGPPGSAPRSLAVAGNRLFAGTSSGLYVLDGSTWVPIAPVAGKSIVGIAPTSTMLLLCTQGREVFTVDTQGNATQIGPTLPFAPTGITADAAGNPAVGTTGGGIMQFAAAWVSSFPNGPNGNPFINVTVDPDGVVWGASGAANGRGLYRFDGKEWVSYTAQNSALPANDIWRVSATCGGDLWASSWGRGVTEIPFRTDSISPLRVFGTNVGMVGIPNDPLYVVTGNVVCDARGNVWTTILNAADKNVFAVRTPDGTWRTLPAILSGTRLSLLTDGPVDRSLAVDAFDNLWAVIRDGSFRGVMSLANAGTIDSVADIHVTAANGLPSDDIRTLVVDRDNDIWVGTSKGIAIILDPQNPKRSGGIAAYKPLNGLVINSIAVDPLNQKWVGTTEGVILLSPDGTQVLAAYTAENTEGKLILNDVQSVGVDPKTGTVFFGTAGGLASLTTAAAEPVASFGELKVYPNPYRVPNTAPLTIDGLVENCTLKILTIDGTLVREVVTPGGRLGYWDGKDTNGNDVASGIYIVVGYSGDGAELGNGKVAVVRR